MDISPDQLANAITLVRLGSILVPLAVVLNVAISLWAARRRPPITEELYRDFATKAEVHALREEIRRTLSELFTRQHTDQGAIEDKFQSIMNMLGTVNGKLARCPYLCKFTEGD